MADLMLRPYTAADEDAAIELWRRSWKLHYPHIDFDARVPWWRERWRNELVPVATITLAEIGGALAGFVTVDPKTMYLDQIVVAPEHWGSDIAAALVAVLISVSAAFANDTKVNAKGTLIAVMCSADVKTAVPPADRTTVAISSLSVATTT